MNRTVKAHIVKAAKVRSLREGAFCKYTHRVCMQNCIDGYDFCIRHILEDKTAPFKQCAYMTKSGRRCLTAAPKQERKDGYCADHAKKALIARQRLSRKRRPRETAECLLEELVTQNSGSADTHNNEHRRGKMHSDSIASKALEYASSSDSETEAPLVEQAWRDDGDSDAESIDSDQEDMLKYAGVYTTEEVAQILRDKLIRLQALYIDQFKRLKHVLLSKRRQYLQAYKTEREAYGSVKLYKKDPFQKDKYAKLCAMKRYHKKYGKEALMQRQSTHRRMQATEGVTYHPPHFHKCVFVDEGLRCNARVVPLSKYCQRHILHDSCQVLYRPCPFADSQCGRPVPVLFNTEFCSMHQPVPPLKDLTDQGEAEEEMPQQMEIKEEVKEEADETAVTSASQEGGPSGLYPSGQGQMEVKMEVDPDPPAEKESSHSKVGERIPHVSVLEKIKEEDGGEKSRPLYQQQQQQIGVLFTLGEEEEEEDGQAR